MAIRYSVPATVVCILVFATTMTICRLSNASWHVQPGCARSLAVDPTSGTVVVIGCDAGNDGSIFYLLPSQAGQDAWTQVIGTANIINVDYNGNVYVVRSDRTGWVWILGSWYQLTPSDPCMVRLAFDASNNQMYEQSCNIVSGGNEIKMWNGSVWQDTGESMTTIRNGTHNSKGITGIWGVDSSGLPYFGPPPFRQLFPLDQTAPGCVLSIGTIGTSGLLAMEACARTYHFHPPDPPADYMWAVNWMGAGYDIADLAGIWVRLTAGTICYYDGNPAGESDAVCIQHVNG